MCGRTATVATYRQYYEHFLVSGEPSEGGLERYNLPPSSYLKKSDPDSIQWEYLPAIRSINGNRTFDMLIWKLIPHWSKGVLPSYSTANCRVEPNESFSQTMKRKASYRSAWSKNQRCLLPVSWFYEWNQNTKPKQPYLIRDINDPFLVFAGLWDSSTTENGEQRISCTIITTEANDLLEQVGHLRSPVMIDNQSYEQWLTGNKIEAEELLVPYPSETLEAKPMPLSVNNPGFDSPELINNLI